MVSGVGFRVCTHAPHVKKLVDRRTWHELGEANDVYPLALSAMLAAKVLHLVFLAAILAPYWSLIGIM